MRPADAPALAALWVASWQEAMPAIDFTARRPFVEGFLADPDNIVLVAVPGAADADGAPLGFAGLAGEVLHQLVVAPAAKGGGAAAALIDAAKARHPRGLALEVNSDNPRAVSFYRRCGFRITAEGCNPSSGLPTLLMRWPGTAVAA